MAKQKFSLRMPSGWIMNGIGKLDYPIELSRTLLEPRTQDEFAQQRRKTKKDFYAVSMPFYHSLFTTLYDNQDNKEFKNGVEEVRQFIKESMSNSGLGTLTRTEYNPKGKKDLIIHDYKQPEQRTIKLDSLVGPDGYILDNDTKNAVKPLQALLDTKQSLQKINDVCRWLTGKDAYMFRVNETPKRSIEAVARFSAYSDRAGLYCSRYPSDSCAGLGVRRAKI